MKKLNRSEWIAISVSLVVVAFLIYGGSAMSIFGGTDIVPPTNNNNNNLETVVASLPESGVQSQELVAGTGEVAAAGDKLTVHYVGVLPSGKVFDSSVDTNQPFTFTLGAGNVIRGWDEGLVGMKEGEVRRVLIAPDYGYGAQAIGAIPANSHLIFEVQLLEVEKAAQ